MKNALPAKSSLLVLGGTGFLGSNLISSLRDKSIRITSVSRHAPESFFRSSSGIRHHTENILNVSFLKHVVKGHDYIVYLAGHSGVTASATHPIRDLEQNCKGSLTLLEACKNDNPRASIVLVGSQLEYGSSGQLPHTESGMLNPDTIYGIHRTTTRLYTRFYARSYGVNVHYVRIPNVYGPHIRPATKTYNIVNYFIDQALHNKDLYIYGSGRQRRDYLFVNDAVSAIIATLTLRTRPGEDFNFGTGKGISVQNLATRIITLTGQGSIHHVPWPGIPDTADHIMSYAKAQKILSWRPAISLDEGLRKTIRFQKRLRIDAHENR